MKATDVLTVIIFLQITNVSVWHTDYRDYLKLGHIFGITKTIRPKQQ
jgi:hypothetical protein